MGVQQPETLLPAPAHVIGPSNRRLADGSWWLPDKNHTIGDHVVNWMFQYVLQPSGPRAGQPFIPTPEQFRFLMWWYAVNDEGRFIYRQGMLRRLKGWGKDPLAAAMSLSELSGPVDPYFEDGELKARPRSAAWVQIAAVSQDQTRNTFSLFPAMASPKMREEYGLDINKTVIYSRAGGIIEGVTSSPLALEGKRPTFVILNEIQWWLENNNGHEMANIIDGNVTKAAYGGCRALAICNAHVPGQDSVAERWYDAYRAIEAGQFLDNGVLLDSIEAPADTPVSEIPHPEDDPEGFEQGIQKLREGLEIARGDAVWLDIDTLIASILDPRNVVSESRRKFLNQINAAEDAWLAPHEWDARHDPQLRKLEPGDRIALAFDGSKSNDWTALVACRIEDAALFTIRVWNPEKYNGEVPREDVDAMVDWVHSRYNVVAFRADVAEFESYVDKWSRKYGKKYVVNATPGKPVAFDMRGQTKQFAFDCERFKDAVLEGALVHNGDPILRQHVLNACLNPTTYDAISIRKASKDSARKIDAAVCAVMAFAARQEVLMSKRNRSRKGAVLRG